MNLTRNGQELPIINSTTRDTFFKSFESSLPIQKGRPTFLIGLPDEERCQVLIQSANRETSDGKVIRFKGLQISSENSDHKINYDHTPVEGLIKFD